MKEKDRGILALISSWGSRVMEIVVSFFQEGCTSGKLSAFLLDSGAAIKPALKVVLWRMKSLDILPDWSSLDESGGWVTLKTLFFVPNKEKIKKKDN